MKFRDRDSSQQEPDDGLDARLTADASAWLGEQASSFTDSPAALPGVPRVSLAPGGVEAADAAETLDVDDAPDADHAWDDGSPDELHEPGVSPPRRSGWARRAPLLVAAAVIALVAAVAIPLWANRSHLARSVDAPMCAAQDGGLPAEQGAVEVAAGSLVPDEVPMSMLICQYPSSSYLAFDPGSLPSPAAVPPEDKKLRASRSITTGLASIPTDLNRLSLSKKSMCVMRVTDEPRGGSEFRVALRYATGVIWLRDSIGSASCSLVVGSRGAAEGSYATLFGAALVSGNWNGTAASVSTMSMTPEIESCPGSLDATPYAGANALPRPAIDTEGALVPRRLPVAVVLCGFQRAKPFDLAGFDSPIGLSSRNFVLKGDFTALVRDLRRGQVIAGGLMECPPQVTPPTPQLMGLTYDEGAARRTIWIDARFDDHCGLATNGSTWALGDHAAAFRDALVGKLWNGVTAVADERDPTPRPSAPRTDSERPAQPLPSTCVPPIVASPPTRPTPIATAPWTTPTPRVTVWTTTVPTTTLAEIDPSSDLGNPSNPSPAYLSVVTLHCTTDVRCSQPYPSSGG